MKPTCIAALAVLLGALVPAAASAQAVVRLPAQDRLIRTAPAQVFSVGKEDGRSWEVLGDVSGAAFDARDNLYVLDRGNHRVLVFDPAGRFVRVVGRRGGGPGEFSAPRRLAVTRQGELVVADDGRQAFSLFGADGAFVRSVPYGEGWFGTGLDLDAHPRGGVVGRVQGLPVPGSPNRGQRLAWFDLQSDGGPTSLFTFPAGSGGTPRVRQAFAPGTHFAVVGNGEVAVAYTDRYEIRVVGPRGVTRVIQRPIAPRRVTAADRQRETERRQVALRQGRVVSVVGPGGSSALPPQAQAALVQQLSNLEFPSVMPVLRGVEADAAGRLWIERSPDQSGGTGRIDVVFPDGRYVGTLTGQPLPLAFSASGRAAYVETDDLGVQRVVVRQIPALN